MSSEPLDSVALSSNATYTRPRTRQRVHKPPPPLQVPHIEHDAAERKRVLNVLAQRRYRERKKAKREGKKGRGDHQHSPAASEHVTPAYVHHSSPEHSDQNHMMAPVPTGTDTMGLGGLTAQNAAEYCDFDVSLDPSFLAAGMEPTVLSTLASNLPLPPSSTSSSSSLHTSSSGAHSLANNSMMPGPGSLPANIDPAYFYDGSSHSSTSPESTTLGFPDSYLLPVNELTLLRAFLRIADRLGVTSEVWKHTANSPFNLGIGTPADKLPANWKPTTTQILMPHHPLLDFLPWPSARDKLIHIFSLPSEARPEPARDALALYNLTYDMEDAAEGIRIWGSDPYDDTKWEVGQVLFERWWFIFDRSVVEQSNRWRATRGATALQMQGPRIEDLT